MLTIKQIFQYQVIQELPFYFKNVREQMRGIYRSININ